MKMDKDKPTLGDVILLVLYHSQERKIPGRTVFQKTIYLIDKLVGMKRFLGRNLRFRYDYYGPFSQTLMRAILKLKGYGLIEERIIDRELHYIYGNTYEPVWTDLIMVPGVEEIAEDLERSFPALSKEIASAVGKLQKLGVDRSYRTLSLAAKIHYVLERAGRKMTPDEIRKTAKTLSWELSDRDINKVVFFLECLGLAERPVGIAGSLQPLKAEL